MEIAYQEVGSGPAVLLLSGWIQPGERWRRVRDGLLPDHRVLTVDNRETGATGPCPDGFTLEDLARDVLAVADRVEIDRFTLAGISMGGMIAQEVVKLDPTRVASVVLLSTRGKETVGPDMSVIVPPPGTVPEGLSEDETRREFLRAIWTGLCGPGFATEFPHIIDEEIALSIEQPTPMDGLIRQMQAIMQFDPGDDVVEALRGIPVMVAHGDADRLVPYENGVELAHRLGVELVTFRGTGHMLECERVDEVVTLIRDAVKAGQDA